MARNRNSQFPKVWKVAAFAAVTGFVVNFCRKFYLEATWWGLPTLLLVTVWILLMGIILYSKGRKQHESGSNFFVIFRSSILPFFTKHLVLGICFLALAIQGLNFVPVRDPVLGDFFLMDKYKVRDPQGEAFYFVFDNLKKDQEQIVPEKTYRSYERGDVVPVTLQPGLFGGQFVKYVGEENTSEPVIKAPAEEIDPNSGENTKASSDKNTIPTEQVK